MPSLGRKFLLASMGGLNLTHAKPFDNFVTRYAGRRENIGPLLRHFDPQALREWVHGLGITTFVGSSGRIFPAAMKAAPLLRARLQRLRRQGASSRRPRRMTRWINCAPGGTSRSNSRSSARPFTRCRPITLAWSRRW